MRSKYPDHIELAYRKMFSRYVVKLAREMVPAIQKGYKDFPVKTDEDFRERLARILESMRDVIQPSEYIKNQLSKIFSDLGGWTTNQTVDIFTRKKGVSKLTIELAIAQVGQLGESEILKNFVEQFQATNLDLVAQAGQEYVEGIYKVAEEGYLNGESLSQMTARMKDLTDGLIEKAQFWAVDQIGDASAEYNKVAQKAAGVTQYRWRTVGDNRVREEHKDLDGNIYDWDTGAPGLSKPGAKHPGQDYRCRCWSEPIFPGEL